MAALMAAVFLVPWHCNDIGTASTAVVCENVVGIRVTLDGPFGEALFLAKFLAILLPIVAGLVAWLLLGIPTPEEKRGIGPS